MVGTPERRAVASGGGLGALVTVDRSLEYQQNVAVAGMGVVVILARSNRIANLLPLTPDVLTALATLAPGRVVRVGSSRPPTPGG